MSAADDGRSPAGRAVVNGASDESPPQAASIPSALLKAIEEAETPTVELFRSAFEAVYGPKPERVLGGSAELTAWLNRFNPYYGHITRYAWLEAAMMLLPGSDWEYSLEWESGSLWWQPVEGMIARVKVGDPRLMMESEAATPGLAMLAAALRAQAIEAQRAETAQTGSVHESAVPQGCAPSDPTP